MYYNSVNEVLDDMIGVNYAITQAQIKGIRALCKDAQVRQRNNLRNVLNLAYAAGKKYDRKEYNRIMDKIDKGRYTLEELGGDE